MKGVVYGAGWGEVTCTGVFWGGSRWVCFGAVTGWDWMGRDGSAWFGEERDGVRRRDVGGACGAARILPVKNRYRPEEGHPPPEDSGNPF